MQIFSHPVGLLSVNCYLLVQEPDDQGVRHALIIDPGDAPDSIIAMIRSAGSDITPDGIFITHAHFDHVGAVQYLSDLYDCPVYVSAEEIKWVNNQSPFYRMMQKAYSSFLEAVNQRACYYRPSDASSDSVFLPPAFQGIVIPVCGHSMESLCLYFKKEHILFSGDTLFEGAIGREDFLPPQAGVLPGTLRKEIDAKLLILPPDTIVYPGHGPCTTIARER